jgi:hypothetical protein
MTDGTDAGAGSPTTQSQRRMIALGMLRALGSTAALVVVYYVLPLDHASTAVAVTALIIGLVALIAVVIVQARSIIRSRYPEMRAIEALGATLPFYLLLFAGTYLVLSSISPNNFTEPLTHTDALYFAVTVFTTVGFGDVTATSESARLVVTGQMAIDLIILVLGVRIIFGAVTRSHRRRS